MAQGLKTRIATRLAEARAIRRIFPKILRARSGSPWTASSLLQERARSRPEDPGLLFADRRLTWLDIDRRVNQWAHALQELGVGAGDVVAIVMENRPEFLFALVALSRVRAVGALANSSIRGRALAHALRIADTRWIIAGSEQAGAVADVLADLPDIAESQIFEVANREHEAETRFQSLDPIVDEQSGTLPVASGSSRAEDPLCYIYTSGTTGLPKAAVISNRRFLSGAVFMGLAIYGLKPGEVAYVPLPLYHSVALFGGWGGALVSGSALAFRTRFSTSEFWQDIRRFRATLFIYIGELCRYLLNQPPVAGEQDHTLRMAAGNGLRPDIWSRFQERFRIPLIREYYGATEAPLALVNFAGRPGMIGRLLLGAAAVRCNVETGELARDVKGRCTRIQPGQTGLLLSRITQGSYDGYLDADATRSKVVSGVFRDGDRFFDTGDLVMLHDDGWLSFADRVGDTFRWKGENVSTNEVAEILSGATGVQESNVYGVEVPGSEGRAGMASIRVTSDFEIKTFARYVCQNLPSYQRPYFVRIQSEMKITATLKHQKVDYRREGYDPASVAEPLYLLHQEEYLSLDAQLYQQIQTGALALR